MLLILLAVLWALLGTSLPLTSSTIDFASSKSPLDLPGNVADPPDFFGHNATISPRAKIVKRPVVAWPWDIPGNNDEREKSNPERYNCNSFAGVHNKIPPRLMMLPTAAGVSNVYTDEEIYRAFRNGALILMDILTNPLNAHQLQVYHNGVSYPRRYNPAAAMRDPNRVRLGLGTWVPRYDDLNRPVPQRTTVIYEWPLIEGGHYPHPNLNNQLWDSNPGFDRVLFQLVRGLPLYLGTVQLASAQTPPNANRPPRGSRDRPTPSQGPGGGGGAGAPGGGSGIGPFPSYGLGGISESGGGAAGPQGAWDLYGGQVAYNAFKRGGPGLLLSGPSHIQF
ncbi:hypothetical protein PG987_008212 [Apiospora arundinis]